MDKAKEAFLKYVSQFDQSKQKVRLKIAHSLRVLALSYLLAERLNLNEEDSKLLNYIALLHDIGRFHQLELTDSFLDKLFDHASYGIKYLFTEGHIKDYLAAEKDYEIIKKAIYYHNKYVLDIPNFDERSNMFIKLIRDLDKIDIVNTINLEYDVYFCKEDVPDSYFDQFWARQSIKIVGNPNPSKSLVVTSAFVYDLNFSESRDIINEKEYFLKYFAKAQVAPGSEEVFMKIKENVLEMLEENENVREKVQCTRKRK